MYCCEKTKTKTKTKAEVNFATGTNVRRTKCLVACLCFRSPACSTKSSSPFRGSSQSRGPWTQSVDAATSGFLFRLHYSPVFCSQNSLPPTSGWRRVSADAVGPVRPLVPHRVLRLCVGAGGSVSALRHIRRLPDERRHLSPHRAVRLLRPSLQAHLHASRWRSRSKKLTRTSTEANK